MQFPDVLLSRLGALYRRLLALFRRYRLERDLDDELAFHLAMRETEHQQGESKESSWRTRRRFGNVTRVKEQARDAWTFQWLESVLQDASYAFRQLRRAPGFTAVALLTLALGIGANTAIVSLVNGVLLRPLPFTDSDRVVYIAGNVPSRPEIMTLPVRMREIPELRKESKTLSGFSTLFVQPSVLEEIVSGEPLKTSRAMVSPTVFNVLEARPILGRVLDAHDEQPGSQLVSVLSYAAWQKYFAADPSVIGTAASLDGMSYTIVGVMPRGFVFPTPDVEIWSAMQLPPSGNIAAVVIARINDGFSRETAAAEINTLFIRMRQRELATRPGDTPPPLKLVSVKEQMIAPVRPALLVILAAGGLVLLIACSNIASLLIARAAARRREVAVRIALGAGPARLIRQVLTESVVLALLGGVAGTLVAYSGVRLLGALEGARIPRLAEVQLDAAFLIIALATSLATGVLFGAAPALWIARSRVDRILTDRPFGGIIAFTFLGRNRARHALAIVQIGLAVVLLIAAGLLVGSFVNLARVADRRE
jgi:predicted permease